MRRISSLLAVLAAIAVGMGPSLTSNASSPYDRFVTGSYSFRFSGQDLANFPFGLNSQIAAVGVFTANGLGSITAGSLMLNDGGKLCTYTLTGGNYYVLADGEGMLTLAPTGSTGTCLLVEPFEFYIAVGEIVSGVGQIVELASSTFTTLSGSTSKVPVSGVAHFQAPAPVSSGP